MARAADLAGDEVRRLATRPGVRRAVRRAGEVARGTASRLPRQRDEITLLASDLAGVATTGILVDGAQAAQARRTARSLGLPRTMDSVSAWNALGALAALIQVADDGRRRAVVIDASGPRSVFSRWATAAGFAPVALDVAEPEVVGERIDAGAADLVALLYPRTVDPADLDVELAHASRAVRKGGLVCSTVQLGPERTGGLGVADLRAFMARAGEQGLATVGNLDLQDAARARAAQSEHQDRPVGLALLTFRRT